ncbi:AAA family ATPase, partial [Streptococcus pneumoniae]|nr:AAA family ATPase [Streptococcus pneumoniae]
GKTQFAKRLIKLFQKIALNYGQILDYCVTASTNAFDEYNGQEILFLDDIKGDSLSISDWLKLLDPYMISPISARYH